MWFHPPSVIALDWQYSNGIKGSTPQLSSFLATKHPSPGYVTFIFKKPSTAKPKAPGAKKPKGKKGGKKNKRGDDLNESYNLEAEGAKRNKKTHQSNKKLTLLNLSKEPKVVPVTQPAPKSALTYNVVINAGFAITKLIQCEQEKIQPQPLYCLSGEEYRESG